MQTSAAPAVCIPSMATLAFLNGIVHRRQVRMHPQSDYRAPALEKGLEIIELLASAPGRMSLADICDRLGRNPNQLFRTLQVLERRRFIMRIEASRAYKLTDRILHLATAQSASQLFPASVINLMRELSDRVKHSCHLSVASDGEAVVIENISSPGDLIFNVALGFRRQVAEVPAGVVLFAFQSQETRLRWLESLAIEDDARFRLVASADRARRSGYLEENSTFAPGITDLCAPIMQQGCAIAAVTIPFVQTNTPTVSRKQVILELCKAAYKMSQSAGGA
jgi:DNA-binding IclR family transcriptional regulator